MPKEYFGCHTCCFYKMQTLILVQKQPLKKEHVVTQQHIVTKTQKPETCWQQLFSYIRGLCCGCVEKENDLR